MARQNSTVSAGKNSPAQVLVRPLPRSRRLRWLGTTPAHLRRRTVSPNVSQMKSGFLEKLIERLGRVGPEEVQNYLLRLAQEKGLIETVFNAIQEGLIVTDAKGRITYVNDAACELFGIDAETSIGKRLDERMRGLDWNALSRSEGAVSRDMEIFYPTNRFINFYVVPLLMERRSGDDGVDRIGEPVGHAMILRDITESRRSTEKTIESERFNALTLLAAGVAHEIGNPLNSLHIHLQLMERKVRKLEGKLHDELQESIDIARSEISRLDSIVSQFLKAIRPSKPQIHSENLNSIVEEAVRFFAPPKSKVLANLSSKPNKIKATTNRRDGSFGHSRSCSR